MSTGSHDLVQQNIATFNLSLGRGGAAYLPISCQCLPLAESNQQSIDAVIMLASWSTEQGRKEQRVNLDGKWKLFNRAYLLVGQAGFLLIFQTKMFKFFDSRPKIDQARPSTRLTAMVRCLETARGTAEKKTQRSTAFERLPQRRGKRGVQYFSRRQNQYQYIEITETSFQ